MAKAEYRSAIRSRKLINAALADLLMEKPLDKITVTDVVRRAEINRGTFYAHYADIPDVIDHLIQQTFSGIRETITEYSGNITDVAWVLLSRIQATMEEDLDFYRKVLSSTAATKMQEQLCGAVLDFLIQQEAEFAVQDHDRFVLTIRFCAGGLTSLYLDWFSGKLPISLDALTDQAAALLQQLIAAVPLEPDNA